ncbi:hypothetical protein PSH62_13650 [Pseudomonas tolaasii]|nr:hypothetical protein [Pseudomonas tolaasii]WLH54617.1 hypothetical protein PSH62_13650 [Pseudomonas tolaasii]
MTFEADGWTITFYKEAGSLRTWESCYSPDGRAYAFTSSQPYSTNPVELLSVWEHQALERLLAAA